VITRRSAQHFHELVESQSTGGAGVRQVGLLDVVGDLRAVPAPVPDPAFVVALRERLIAEAESVLAAAAAERDDIGSWHGLRPTVPKTRRRQRRLAAVAAGVALVGASATVAVAAQSSLPGEGLYPVKRGLEHAHAELTFDRANRGRVLLDSADTRLDEAQELSLERADPTRVSDALDAFTEQAVDGSELLIADYQATADRSSMTTLRTFTVTSTDRLEQLQSQVPPLAFDSLLQAADALEQVQQASVHACSVCDGPLIGSVPSIFEPARHVTVHIWQVSTGKAEHDRSRSMSRGGPSLPHVEGDDRPAAGVRDPGYSTTAPHQPTTEDAEQTVQHLTDGLTDDQQNHAGPAASDPTNDLLNDIGQAGTAVENDVESQVGSDLPGTPIGSQLPTLP